MSHSQFHSTKLFILRHAWLNLWDKRMTTGRINQVYIHSFFFPRIPRDTCTSKKAMQTEICIAFIQEIFEMHSNTNLCLSTLWFIFKAQQILFTEIVFHNKQCSTVTLCHRKCKFTMLLFHVLFDTIRSTKHRFRHKHIRAIQNLKRIIQLCIA